jgi:hypothetical protein
MTVIARTAPQERLIQNQTVAVSVKYAPQAASKTVKAHMARQMIPVLSSARNAKLESIKITKSKPVALTAAMGSFWMLARMMRVQTARIAR